MDCAPFLWKTPSTKTPFFPLHMRKKFGWSKKTSKCLREIKLECPILTSTSPRELFLPMVIRFCRTMYSNSRPSRRAIASPVLSGLHCTLGLAGADLSASRAQASLSVVLEYDVDITVYTHKHRTFLLHFWGVGSGTSYVYPQNDINVGGTCTGYVLADFITARSVYLVLLVNTWEMYQLQLMFCRAI